MHLRHKEETVVVIGNGPSLNEIPMELLQKFTTFGSNRIYLKYIPTYLTVVNPLVLAQFEEEILSIPCTKFLPMDEYKNSAGPIHGLRSNHAPLFHYHPLQWVYEGYTVTFVSLQLAFFMGAKRVILIGVDHRYSYEGSPNAQDFMAGQDPNHFDPAYFQNAHWNNPDLERSEQAYAMAREAYENDGREIINCTPNTALEVFEKGDWQTCLQP